jgi:hypothetical protein
MLILSECFFVGLYVIDADAIAIRESEVTLMVRRLIICTVMVLLLGGCGGAGPDTPTPDEEYPAPQTVPTPDEEYPAPQTVPTPEGYPYPSPEDMSVPEVEVYPDPESSSTSTSKRYALTGCVLGILS